MLSHFKFLGVSIYFINAKAKSSAFIPLYVTNPKAANGAAHIIHNQDIISVDNLPLNRKKTKTEKKNFHIFGDDVVNTFNESLNDPEFQSRAVQFSNLAEKMEDKDIRDVETPDSQKGYMDREDIF